MARCSSCGRTGHTKRKHVGFKTLARRIEQGEAREHPSYSRARLERIGRGAASKVYREQKARKRK